MRDRWDVVVVGAGPAGSIAARELARRGASVLLAERSFFPRSKICGCCLNDAARGALHRIGLGELTTRLGAIPLQGVRIAAGSRTADLCLPGVALSREAFDTALRDAAVEAGATARHGVRVVLGPVQDDHRVVQLQDEGRTETIQAGVVIAANGLAGRLDRDDPAFDSLPAAGSRIGAGVTVSAEDVPDYFEPGRVYMAAAAGGYVGLVRLEDGRLDVAASFDAEFVRSAGSLGLAAAGVLLSVGWPVPEALDRLPWKGTPALTRRPRAVAGPHWFAVGDAAGYVEPFTGEGMAWAIQSALAVVPLVQRAVQGWSASLALEWETALPRLLGRRRRACWAVARVLRSPRACHLALRLLSVFPSLSRPFIAGLNRLALRSPERIP